MYIRFTTKFTDEDGEARTGLFSALRFIKEHPFTSDEDVKTLTALRDWFNNNLDAPDKFSNAKNKNPESISLSWFKDTAKEHIKKVYNIREVLYHYGIVIEVTTTKNPGYVLYADDYQVSAIPFKSDKNRVK